MIRLALSDFKGYTDWVLTVIFSPEGRYMS